MSFVDNSRALFTDLKKSLFNELKGNEELSLALESEDSLFVRFHNSNVRQNTHVEQNRLELIFQKNNRRMNMSVDLTSDFETDLAMSRSLIQRARAETDILPEDPGVTPFENRGSSNTSEEAKVLDFEELLKTLKTHTEGTDFTGLLASGPQIRANANSKGQEHWFSTRSFFLDYSLFTVNESKENKAVKKNYADKEWSTEKFVTGLSSAKNQLALLRRPTHTVQPGKYRVFLAPGAVSEMAGMMSWNALSYGSYKKGGCAFKKLADKEVQLSKMFNARENFDLGLNTPFNELGELPAAQIELIQHGELKNFLVSTRSSHEFGVPSNFASSREAPRSLEIKGGDLAEKEALKALGTGLYLGNLHYLNWSDPQSARITGMTRYACFWVENGEIVAPIRDLRFDESLFHAFGTGLEAVTREQHIDPTTETYFLRAMGGKKIPGMLVNNFAFTL